jgi:hypothetical protein
VADLGIWRIKKASLFVIYFINVPGKAVLIPYLKKKKDLYYIPLLNFVTAWIPFQIKENSINQPNPVKIIDIPRTLNH